MHSFTYSTAALWSDASATTQPGSSSLITPAASGEVLLRNNVRVLGQGKPPLLLCNGFGYNQRMWHHLTTMLAVHHQVILFDHVGSGESDRRAYDRQKYDSLHGYAQDVVEIGQELALSNAIFVGHSVSAMIGVLASVEAPGLFSDLVLVGPSPR